MRQWQLRAQHPWAVLVAWRSAAWSGSSKPCDRLSWGGQRGVQDADDPMNLDVGGYACVGDVLSDHVFILNDDKTKQLAVVCRVCAKPMHSSGRCGHGIQCDPGVATGLRLISGVKIRRHISFHQHFDHAIAPRAGTSESSANLPW